MTSLYEDADLVRFKAYHDEASQYIVRGTEHEQKGNDLLAKKAYLKGVQKLEQALAIRCDQPHCVGPNWRSARRTQKKMTQKLGEMQERLSILTDKLEHSDQKYRRPPTYNDSFSKTNRNQRDPSSTGTFNGSASKSTVVEELFSIPHGVQLFYVTPEDDVTTLSKSSFLRIYKSFNRQTPTRPTVAKQTAWLQIAIWKIPLVPGESAMLRSEDGTYLLLDTSAPQLGEIFKIVLPSTTSTVRIFENLMTELADLKVMNQLGKDERSSLKISKAIVTGSEHISDVITKTAEVTGQLVHFGASKLMQWLTPEQPIEVDPKLQKELEVIRYTTSMAQQVTGYVVNKLCDVTCCAGKALAPLVQVVGTELLDSSELTTDSARKVDDVMIVAGGGLQGAATIYASLLEAAKNVAYCLGNETVKVVSHKYGTEAGVAADNAVSSIGNVALTAHHVSNLGVKAIVKRTAKDTGKAVFKEYIGK